MYLLKSSFVTALTLLPVLSFSEPVGADADSDHSWTVQFGGVGKIF